MDEKQAKLFRRELAGYYKEATLLQQEKKQNREIKQLKETRDLFPLVLDDMRDAAKKGQDSLELTIRNIQRNEYGDKYFVYKKATIWTKHVLKVIKENHFYGWMTGSCLTIKFEDPKLQPTYSSCASTRSDFMW